jgi:hypothetical protein
MPKTTFILDVDGITFERTSETKQYTHCCVAFWTNEALNRRIEDNKKQIEEHNNRNPNEWGVEYLAKQGAYLEAERVRYASTVAGQPACVITWSQSEANAHKTPDRKRYEGMLFRIAVLPCAIKPSTTKARKSK